MVIAAVRAELHLPEVHSLKAKRGIVQGAMAGLRGKWPVSVADVDALDTWQTAILGIAVVSNEARHANQVASAIAAWLEEGGPGWELVGYGLELVHL